MAKKKSEPGADITKELETRWYQQLQAGSQEETLVAVSTLRLEPFFRSLEKPIREIVGTVDRWMDHPTSTLREKGRTRDQVQESINSVITDSINYSATVLASKLSLAVSGMMVELVDTLALESVQQRMEQGYRAVGRSYPEPLKATFRRRAEATKVLTAQQRRGPMYVKGSTRPPDLRPPEERKRVQQLKADTLPFVKRVAFEMKEGGTILESLSYLKESNEYRALHVEVKPKADELLAELAKPAHRRPTDLRSKEALKPSSLALRLASMTVGWPSESGRTLRRKTKT